jgi:hypothetical protein
MSGRGSNFVWKIMVTLCAILAATLARRVIETTWTTATGKQPPANPHSPDTTMAEAVGWAVASGAAVGVARLLATRKAADYWRRSTGNLPPGMEEVL